MWHRLCRIRPFPRLISKRECLLYELPLISHEHWALSILSVYSPVNHFSRKTLFYLKLKLNFVRFCRKMVIFVKIFFALQIEIWGGEIWFFSVCTCTSEFFYNPRMTLKRGAIQNGFYCCAYFFLLFNWKHFFERNFIIQTFVSKIKEMGHGNSK